MIKRSIDLSLPCFNNYPIQKRYNSIYSKSQNLAQCSRLAHELFDYLKHQQIVENEFYVLPFVNDYNKYFFKYFIALHTELLINRLSDDYMQTEAQYTWLYFRNVLLAPLYEETMYKNIYYSDFSSYFDEEHLKLTDVIRRDFPNCVLFDDFLNKKLERYAKAHTNYLKTFTINEIFNEQINYGFKRLLES